MGRIYCSPGRNSSPIPLAIQLATDTGIGAIPAGSTVNFTGHSLGGYLAAAVEQQYGSAVSATYLYNAPGVLGPIGNILSLFGLTDAAAARERHGAVAAPTKRDVADAAAQTGGYFATCFSRSSSSVLQSIQSVAVGRASRRFSPISMPQLSQ